MIADDDNDESSFNSDDNDGYVNGDDAYPEYGETDEKASTDVELWKDDIRSQNKIQKHGSGHSFEMVPLSEDERGEFNYDNEDINADDDDDDRRYKRQTHSSHNAPFSGDDYQTSNTILPQKIYHYIYPPNVPRSVQLCRPENIAVPACYLLVGLLQGLSGPFTNVYPLDLNASEAQQVSDIIAFICVCVCVSLFEMNIEIFFRQYSIGLLT